MMIVTVFVIYGEQEGEYLLCRQSVMEPTVRDLKNVLDYEGSITDDGVYHFPALQYKDGASRTRQWDIYVRLVRDDKERIDKLNWDLDSETMVPIKKKYLDTTRQSSLPDDVVAEYWTETGIVGKKITRHFPTYPEAKNAGRSNERNVLLQAIVKARSEYLSKLKKIGVSSTATASASTTTTTSDLLTRQMYFPMLANNYTDKKATVVYPCISQVKLDGVRSIAYKPSRATDAADNDIVMYSRNKTPVAGFSYIKKDIAVLLSAMAEDGFYIDGELYKHGMHLNAISGISRNKAKSENAACGIAYHVFDCFNPSKPNLQYIDRIKVLEQAFAAVHSKLEHVVFVAYKIVQDEDELDADYHRLLENGYEGQMVKKIDGIYKFSSSKTGTRSSDILKRKQWMTDEYKIVDFCEGEGKDKGAVIWICEISDDGARFNVAQNVPYNERRKLYKDASQHIGKLLTVKYLNKSPAGIPLYPRGEVIRDYE